MLKKIIRFQTVLNDLSKIRNILANSSFVLYYFKNFKETLAFICPFYFAGNGLFETDCGQIWHFLTLVWTWQP